MRNQDLKGISMIRKTLLVSLALACAALAAQDSAKTPANAPDSAKATCVVRAVDANASRLDKIEQAVGGALAKAGINLGGEFSSQFLVSGVEGRAVRNNFRKEEGVEFTACDLDIAARPASELQARLMFRFYEDWRNMWNSFKDPIDVRWISVNGLVKEMFSYDIGDFRQKYSPLTLYSPDVDVLFEPVIFAQQRKTVMNEMFLGNNDRILQGINMNFDAEVAPMLKELHVNLLGSRLRSVEGSSNAQTALHLDTALMDKYVVGSNLDLTIFRGLQLGGSFLDIFDATHTYGGTVEAAQGLAQNTRVFAGRGNAGTGLFTDGKTFDVSVAGEVAVSQDDTAAYDTISRTPLTVTRKFNTVSGLATDVGLKGSVCIGQAGNLNLNASFVRNESEFRNELAQSPTLFKTRIMNSENDLGNNALYSTFDAMYRQVFKFSPSENAQNYGSAAGYLKGPMNKIAYANGILTQRELKKIPLDSALGMAMPLGPATPNRTGVTAGLSADFLDKAILVSGAVKYLTEIDGLYRIVDTTNNAQGTMPASNFLEIGGGASVDAAALGRFWPHPLIISGSYKLSQAANDGVAGYVNSPWTIDVSFINAGLYWTFIKKMSLLGGWQYLVTDGDGLYDNVKHTLTQLHYSVGLEYAVSEGARVTGSFGAIEVSRGNDANVDVSAGNFRQYQTELFLTVGF
jgi:hypothetical protein